MKLLLLILIIITNTPRAILTNERCLELGQKNIVLTCPPCLDPEPDVVPVEWCIQGTEIPTKCSRGDFWPEFEFSVINDDLLLPRVLRFYDKAVFNCTRSCNSSENIVQRTEVSVSSLLKNVIFKRQHDEEKLWRDTETGRYLCFGGLDSGNMTFSWLYDGQELREVEDISDKYRCSVNFECDSQECLLPIVKNLTTTDKLPHPYVLKRSACKLSNNSITDGDFIRYTLLLFFGVVSTEYQGIHHFVASEHLAGKTTIISDVSTNVIVSQADVKPRIELPQLVFSNTTIYVSKQSNNSVVCKVTGRRDVDANTRWTRNNRMIPQLNSTSTCSKAATSVFYTVISDTIRTRDYPNNTVENNSVIASSFVVTLHLCHFSTAIEGDYRCEAYGFSKQVHVMVKEEKSSERENGNNDDEFFVLIGFIILNSILLAAIATTLIVLCWIRHSNKKQYLHHQIMSHNTGLPVYLHGAHTSSLQDGDLKSDALEFPYDQLEILHPLGEGNFGRVYKARANDIIPGDNVRNIVAVKTLKDNARPSDIADLEQELYILKRIQPHCNILNLLGYCNKPGVPLCIIIEFAFHGSLKEFLKLCRQHLDKQPTNGHHTPVHSGYLNDTGYYNELPSAMPVVAQQAIQHYVNNDNDWYMYPQHTSDYYNTSPSQLQKDYQTKLGRLSVTDIYFFILQIAKGMEHIGRMKLLHRDLAARNVLIAEGFVLKIGDFGLSRNLNDKDYYRKTSKGMIPARWMALESLDGGVHTYQSDVWSYGVVIWEILTYADLPYGTEHFTKSIKGIIEYLRTGNRLAPPKIYGSIFYPIMSRCWEADPTKRPSFSELAMLCEAQITELTSS